MPRRQLANLDIDALEKLFDEKRESVDVLTTLLGERRIAARHVRES